MDRTTAREFTRMQARLGEAWLANRPGSGVEHLVVVLPSHTVAESLLVHYGPRVRALEHRYLVVFFLLHRLPECEIVFLCGQDPDPEVLAYYDSLGTGPGRASAMERFHVVVVDDGSTRPLSAKLLDRPDLLEQLRERARGRPAMVQPWNVTDLEVEVALRLGAPLNGTSPRLWPLGYKSAGRRIMTEAGVPVPFGRHVRSVDDAIRALGEIQTARPEAVGAVLKLDDSGAGDGNMVIGLFAGSGSASELELRERVESLPDWYLADLRAGGVAEELITGTAFRSPSAQLYVDPFGEVTVLSTHEQLLGGDSGQIFLGCQFPADPGYAALIARQAQAVGRAYAERGAVGRLGVDFAVVKNSDGRWESFALEVNLRNGGTTHPFTILRHLVPGHYDLESSQWLAADGSPRSYRATDNMVEVSWLGLPPAAVITALIDHDLAFDPASGTGVVPHMLSSLAIDGRLGLTAIGHSPHHATELFDATREAVHAIDRSRHARAGTPPIRRGDSAPGH